MSCKIAQRAVGLGVETVEKNIKKFRFFRSLENSEAPADFSLST